MEQTENKTLSLTSNTLKYIAIIAMFIDHAAVAFVQNGTRLYTVMRLIGRITGPTMFYFAVEGYHHTRNFEKYLLRLLSFALISYLPFLYFTYGNLPNQSTWFHFNVLFTIFLGLVGVHVRRKVKSLPLQLLLIVALLFLVTPADWGVTGFMMILVFDYFYDDFQQQMFGYLLILLFSVGLMSQFIVPFETLWYQGQLNLSYPLTYYNLIQWGHLIPMVLLSFYKGEQGKRTPFSKWFFYIFYPLHQLLLGWIRWGLLG